MAFRRCDDPQGEAKTPESGLPDRIRGSGHQPCPVRDIRRAGNSVSKPCGPRLSCVSVAWWLAAINLLLGLFNLLPGAPLDGGRLVRAYLWRRHGDSVRAAVGAAHAGRVVAIILITLGLAEFLQAA